MSQHPASDARQILARNIESLNSRDIEGYLANQHPDVEFVLPGGATLRGRDQVRESTEALWAAFPDGTLTFGEQVFGEDSAAVEVTFTGTHTGPMSTPSGNIPPTGRKVQTRSASVLRFKDGLISSEHVYMDQQAMLIQLGLASAPS